jgi:phosphatidylserine decarboxylase
MCAGSRYPAKEKLCQESSQPWSAWPRSPAGRSAIIQSLFQRNERSIQLTEWRAQRIVMIPINQSNTLESRAPMPRMLRT